MEETNSPIQNFYKNANVFITGGTGFLGKVLIEKLLRSTHVSTLFLLVREKKGVNINVRCEKIFEGELFSKLKLENPNFHRKIEIISGDCSLTDLGISNKDRETIISKINIVFHIAATVNMKENLKRAFKINVMGTKRVLDLAMQMTHLKSIVHVSTAYSNYPYEIIEEKIYDFPMNFESIKRLVETCDENKIEMDTSRIIGDWPNTYCFTKALAESLLKDLGTGLPLAIFRPGIVLSTYKEPLEGWIDNFYGPTGIFAAMMMGLMRVSYADKKRDGNVIPVDTCVAGLIATAWDSATKFKRSSEISVYNHVSSTENEINWGEFSTLAKLSIKTDPDFKSLWTSSLYITGNSFVFKILTLILHIIPGTLIDCLAIITRKNPRMLKRYKQIYDFSIALSDFSKKSWKYSNKNISNLWKKLSSKDKELFPMSITTVHWLTFFRTYVMGIKRYLIKIEKKE